MRTVGTVVRGIRTPIICTGDPLQRVVVDSLLLAAKEESFSFRDRDIVAITEAVVAIAQGNYATVDQIAVDIRSKYPSGHIGVVFPTPLSRNRFAILLQGIARGAKKLTILYSYPADEVGNALFREDLLENFGINPCTDEFSGQEYEIRFGDEVHPITGINYPRYYREIVEKEGCEIDYLFSNRAASILDFCSDVLVANVHRREKTKRQLREAGANVVFGTDDILTQSVLGSGYNPKYGLLGSNRATEEKVKLFPRDGERLVNGVQQELRERTSKEIEVLVYGDGAFKDPVTGIWELADPVSCVSHTEGLGGTPNEVKLKYLVNSQFSSLQGEELNRAVKETIRQKDKTLTGKMWSQGTTPRRFTDLLSSLCDLTTGSGDKGTPVVLIQGYFDNYSDA